MKKWYQTITNQEHLQPECIYFLSAYVQVETDGQQASFTQEKQMIKVEDIGLIRYNSAVLV